MHHDVARAIKILKRGGVVAAPTETVYGLFADASNDSAVQSIYRIKGRPSCNPLIVHVSNIKTAEEIADFSDDAREVARYFWYELGAPLTIVLPQRSKNISRFVTAGLETIAIRRPNHPKCLEMIDGFGWGLAAPSANRSNSLSPTCYDMVLSEIGGSVPLILDGGACEVGLESTIIDMSLPDGGYCVLRPGGVLESEIEGFLGRPPSVFSKMKDIKAPGMMKKHYSPGLPLRINAAYPMEKEAFIGFGSMGDLQCDINISCAGDLREAAKNLFSALKRLDDPAKFSGIAVVPIPKLDIGIAINDRIMRASAR